MNSEERFDQNVEKLERITPEVALKMQFHDPSEWEWCETRQGERNLQLQLEGKTVTLHSSYSAKKEAEKWFKGLNLSHVEVLFVYGCGLGYYYEAAKPWLAEDPSRYLVLIEDDMSILCRLFETELGTEILDDRQVQIHYFQDFEQGESMFSWVTWYFVNCQPEVSALQFYDRMKQERAIELRRKMLHDAVMTESAVGEYLRYGASFYNNFFHNALRLPESYRGHGLFGEFEGVPAIICGAGPSLNKNLDVLKGLSDKALILAGGSSLNALSAQGFLPHFAGGIDPNVTQYERLMSNSAYEVPFFYRNRMHYKAFRTIHGPRLYVNGAGGYDIAKSIEEELGLEDNVEVNEGHNVINFLMSIAYFLGCRPIVLVGMDLAFTGMQSYASGVIPDASVEKEEIINVRNLESGAFPRKDIYGKEVYTLWKWVSESAWVSQFAEEAREQTEVINATEGGIGFEGVRNLSLKEVAEQYFKESFDLNGLVHTKIQNARMPDVTRERVLEVLHELRDGLVECRDICDRLISEFDRIEKLVKKQKVSTANLQTGEAAMLEVSLREHPAYKAILGVLMGAKSKILDREAHRIEHDWTLKSETQKQLALLKLNRDKIMFLGKAAQANLQILELVVKEHGENEGLDVSAFFQEKKETEKV